MITERERQAVQPGAVLYQVDSIGFGVTVQCMAPTWRAALRVVDAEHPGVLWCFPFPIPVASCSDFTVET